MNRLKLLKNKLARFALNVFVVVAWLNFWGPLFILPEFGFGFFQKYIWFGFMYEYLCLGFGGGDEFHPFCISALNDTLVFWIGEIISIAVIAFISKFIWSKRIKIDWDYLTRF